MQIEWITPCREVTGDFPTTNIIGANATGVLVNAEFPCEGVPLRVAACILATPEEATRGGIATLAMAVTDPAGTVIARSADPWGFEDGEGVNPELPRRVIVALDIEINPTTEGVYWVHAGFSDQPPLKVPYAVLRFPEI